MTDTAVMSLPHAMSDADRSPRWPVIVGVLTSWLLPATTASRTAHASLGRICVLHLSTGVLTAALIAFFFEFIPEQRLTIESVVSCIGCLVDDLQREMNRFPIQSALTVLSVALLIEVGHLLLAVIVAPWGALDESLWRSFRNALRQVWLRTPHACVIVIVICGLTHELGSWSARWSTRGAPLLAMPAAPAYPNVTPSDPGYTKAMADYKAALREFRVQVEARQQEYQNWYRAQPWYLRNKELLGKLTGCVAVGWWLWALLRAAGVSRIAPPIERPPQCLFCGYNLMTISMESRCPECGQAVIASLGPDAQPGIPWMRPRVQGRFGAWWRTVYAWTRDTTAFGRSLRMGAPALDHRPFLAFHLPFIIIVGFVGMITGFLQGGGWEEFARDPLAATFLGGVFGSACAMGTTLVILATAAAVGWVASLRAGRNLLPASIQVAAYGAGYLLVWSIFGAVIINSAMHLYLADWYNAFEVWTGIHRDALLFFSCFFPNLICALFYLRLVARGTMGARYANR